MGIRLMGGRVLDPASTLDEVTDIYVLGGVIAGLGRAPRGFKATREIVVEGCVVGAAIVVGGVVGVTGGGGVPLSIVKSGLVPIISFGLLFKYRTSRQLPGDSPFSVYVPALVIGNATDVHEVQFDA